MPIPAITPDGGLAPDTHTDGFVHTQAEIRRHVQQEVAESACMRKHGVPDMPDPNSQGAIVFPPGGPNPSQPQFQAAQKKCAYLNP
jgi:hypothetical protein